MKTNGDFPTKDLAAGSIRESNNSNYITHSSELILTNAGQMELLLDIHKRGVPLRTKVRGFSMQPFIRDQDVLTIAPLNNKQPRIGEVVAFKHPENGRLVIHRIIKQTNSGWLLKGDNSHNVDGFVRGEEMIGHVTRIERNGNEVRIGLKCGIINLLIACFSRYNMLSILIKLISAPLRLMRSKREV